MHGVDIFMREGITESAVYVYLDGEHSHDYVACNAIPFALPNQRAPTSPRTQPDTHVGLSLY